MVGNDIHDEGLNAFARATTLYNTNISKDNIQLLE